MTRRFSRLAHKIWRRRLTLELLERRDVPSFLAPQAFPAGTSPYGIAGGDFNSDGLNDIVVTNLITTGTVSVLLNQGGGIFGMPKSFPVADPCAIAVADFDGNGTIDLAVANQSSGTVSILRGSGNGAFRLPRTYATGPSPTSITVGDFNEDGSPDLAVTNAVSNGSVSVLINNADGSFESPVSYLHGTTSHAVTTGDLNGDGHNDLVAVGYKISCDHHDQCSPKDGRIKVWFGNGLGAFQSGPTYFNSSPGAVELGDFDSDGDLDLVTANTHGFDKYQYVQHGSSVNVRLGTGTGNFGGANSYEVGVSPRAVEVADIDADGDLDLAVPVYGGYYAGQPNHMKVLLGNGNGSFVASKPYPSGSRPVNVAILDFTGDGRRDVAVVNAIPEGTVVVLPGGDGGELLVAPTYRTSSRAYAVTAADLNGDGDPDLAVGSNPSIGALTVLIGASGSVFQSNGDYFPGPDVAGFGAHDFDDDGIVDLAIANDVAYQGAVTVLPGLGSGKFQDLTTYPGGVHPKSAVAVDIDADGVLDIVTVSSTQDAGGDSPGVNVLLGNGDGSFQSPITSSAGKYAFDLATGDLNHDGLVDLVVSNWGSDTVTVLLGLGTGVFAPPVIFSVGNTPRGIIVADFTGDGDLDVATADSYGDTVSVLVGKGEAGFEAAVPYAAGDSPEAIAVGDFNDDGFEDLTATNAYGGFSVLLGNGDGTFQAANVFADASEYLDVHVADFNGDGQDDLALTHGATVSFRLGNGDGTFYPSVSYPTSAYGANATVADFNADGALDIAVAQGLSDYVMPGVALLYGTGDGTFSPAQTYVAGPLPRDVVAGDFDGDGRLDIAVPNSYGQTPVPGVVVILAGIPDGFDAPRIYRAGPRATDLALGDFNGDGRIDAAVANSTNAGTVSLLLGTNIGSFGRPTAFAVGRNPVAVEAGDFNGDGNLDLVAVNPGNGFDGYDNRVSVLLGIGSGTFQPATHYTTQVGPRDIVVADFDGDEILDFGVIHNHSEGMLSILLGNGDGTFQPPIDHIVGSDLRSVITADFNKDSIPDLALASAGNNTVIVLLGDGDGTFQTRFAFAVNDQPQGLATADFDGDSFPDIAVTVWNRVAILVNAGDWPPLPIGDGPSVEGGFAPLNVGDPTDEFQPTTTEERTAVGEPMNPADETETAPQRKYAARRIARVVLAETTDAALEPFSMELQ